MGTQRLGEQAEVQVRQGLPGGGRGRLDTGKLGVWPEQQVTGEATGSPRAGRSNTRWRCKRPEG
jgi:hypothetical protein